MTASQSIAKTSTLASGQSITISTDSDEIYRIRFRVDNGAFTFSSADEQGEFEGLQEIWASDDGFQDGDDNDLEVTIENLEFGDSLEDLKVHAFNIFDEDEVARKVAASAYLGLFHRDDTSITEDEDTGEMVADIEGNFKTSLSRVISETFERDLRDWEHSTGTTGRIFIWKAFNEIDNVTADELDNDISIRTFLSFLESIRTEGSSVGSDASEEATYNNRTYSLAVGSSTVIFELDDAISNPVIVSTYPDSDAVRNLTFTFSPTDASDEASSNEFRTALRASTGTFSVTRTEKVADTVVGSPQQTLVSKLLKSPTETYLQWHNNELHMHEEDGSYVFASLFGKCRMVQSFDSEERLNSAGEVDGYRYTLSNDSNYHTVFFDNNLTINDILKLPRPLDFLPYDANARVLFLQNIRTDTDRILITDWDDSSVLTLLRNERITVSYSRETEGAGKIFLNGMARRQQTTFETVRFTNNADELVIRDYFQEFVRIEYASYNLYIIPFTMRSGSDRYQDNDAFTSGDRLQESRIGNLNPTPGYDPDTDFNSDGNGVFDDYSILKFRYEGTFHAHVSFNLRFDVGSEGSMPDHHLQLYRENDDGDGIDLIISQEQAGYGGSKSQRTYSMTTTGYAVADKAYFFALKISNTSSITEDELRMLSQSRHITLEPVIVVEDDGSDS